MHSAFHLVYTLLTRLDYNSFLLTQTKSFSGRGKVPEDIALSTVCAQGGHSIRICWKKGGRESGRKEKERERKERVK